MIGCVAQLGERRPYKANVGSSNLSTPTILLILSHSYSYLIKTFLFISETNPYAFFCGKSLKLIFYNVSLFVAHHYFPFLV
jgi:hypothetical protein